MLVIIQDIIVLKNSSTAKELVAVDGIPNAFKQDFKLLFFGKTLLKKDYLLYNVKAWILFMFNKYKG